ncbi:hypothetical protein MSPP1_003094 [Malassezia sp. CBS 17886]|nr:hypothetical protein MSPP1_003094 [Malassezia sp. CBS 17886]
MALPRHPVGGAYVLDGYDELDVIGSGTFGFIRKVRRKADGVCFARKELHFERMSERDRKHIVSEVNILRTLQHGNVVRYEERFVDSENGILYIVMELCEGGDLGAVIKRCRRAKSLLPEDTVWSYFAQMAAALEACHYRAPPAAPHGTRTTSQAILHRDLKPENVFLDGDQRVKLGDFGLSKQITAQTFASTYVGTPYYMSPELAAGQQYDIKSDIWALGCIVYELCALSHRTLQREKERVEAAAKSMHDQETALRRREDSLLEREAALAQREDSLSASADSHARSAQLAERERVCLGLERELASAHAQWAGSGERAQLCYALAATEQRLAEKDAVVDALSAQLANASRRPSAQAVRQTPRRISGVSRRVSGEADEEIRARIAGGALALATPRVERGGRESAESDEWVDQEEAGEKSGRGLERTDAPRASAVRLPILPAVARIMRADVSDCTMKDASTILRDGMPGGLPPDDTETRPYLLTPKTRRTSVPASTVPDAAGEVATACEAPSMPTSRTMPMNLASLPQDPQWHLCEEEERPSPFLKRVTRVPLDLLANTPLDSDEAQSAPLVPGPWRPRGAKGKVVSSPFTKASARGQSEQENGGAPHHTRPGIMEPRRRRSSLLRPPEERSALPLAAARGTDVPRKRSAPVRE